MKKNARLWSVQTKINKWQTISISKYTLFESFQYLFKLFSNWSGFSFTVGWSWFHHIEKSKTKHQNPCFHTSSVEYVPLNWSIFGSVPFLVLWSSVEGSNFLLYLDSTLQPSTASGSKTVSIPNSPAFSHFTVNDVLSSTDDCCGDDVRNQFC